MRTCWCLARVQSCARSAAGNPLANPLLFWDTCAAPGVHIAALYTPGLNTLLGIAPVTGHSWLVLFGLATLLLAVMEFYKWRARRFAL